MYKRQGDTLMQGVGNGIIRPGVLAANIGTSCQISGGFNEPLYDEKFRTNTFCHVKEDLLSLIHIFRKRPRTGYGAGTCRTGGTDPCESHGCRDDRCRYLRRTSGDGKEDRGDVYKRQAFVDPEVRVKEKTGSMLLVYEGAEYQAIHLDDYLTKKQWEKIDKLRATVGPINTVQVKELEYYMKKGKAIPVKLTLVNGIKPEKVLTLKLSNHSSTKYAYNAVYELDKYENNTDTNLTDKQKKVKQEVMEKRQNELKQDKSCLLYTSSDSDQSGC